MDDLMQCILEGKRKNRKELIVLPISEKFKILEKLRDRNILIASTCQTNLDPQVKIYLEPWEEQRAASNAKS